MVYAKPKNLKENKIVLREKKYRLLWIKFSHISILSVNNTTSLCADLFQQCSNLALTVQVLKYLTPWFHRSLLLLREQLNTRASFGILCPANPTQFTCWVTVQTASPVVMSPSSLTPVCSWFSFSRPNLPKVSFYLNPWLYGDRGDKKQRFFMLTFETA